jgi:UDP-GlcNAc3NAcA epimerase
MILTIIGARPQFVKAAVLSKALQEVGIPEKIVHTGQHYDYKMSEIFFEELNIPKVAFNLNVGSSSHGVQTGEMMIAIEKIVLDNYNQLKAILVYGDTNSTAAGALVAAKLHIPVIHVEAGLRSFDKTMPEEINRIVTDHISTILFCSSTEGVNQLAKEGIANNVYNVGDIMYDAVKAFSARSKAPQDATLQELILTGNFVLVTLHRPSNTDDTTKMQLILDAMAAQQDQHFIWPVHPRNKATLSALYIPANLLLIEPFSYFEMLHALQHCQVVITDSGGLQKEAYWMQKPCITLRNTTEWIETLHHNWNQLCNLDTTTIADCLNRIPTMDTWVPLYGNGNTSTEIAAIIKKQFYSQIV